MKRFLVITLILALTAPVFGLELVRQKNVATIITFPILDSDGDTVTGAAGLDSEEDNWSDSAAPDGFADCTNEATEIGTTGIYYLSLTAAQMNVQYKYIQVKTSTVGAKTQHILIRTTAGAPANAATNFSTTIAAGTHTTTSFVLTDGPTANNWFGNRYWYAHVIDATNSMPAYGMITSYVGATKTVKIIPALPFTPEADDTVYLLPLGPFYAPGW